MGRMFFPSLATAVTATALAITPASADDKIVEVAPATPWSVHYGEEKCRLSRIFGDGENKTILFMEQWGPDDRFGFTIAGPGFEKFVSERKTRFQFSDGQEPLETEPYVGDVEGYGKAVIHTGFSLDRGTKPSIESGEVRYGLPQVETDLARKAQFISVSQGKRQVILKTGPMADAFTVLNQCSHQRLIDWGLDLEEQLNIKQMPLWTNEQQVAQRIAKSYPRKALMQRESAIVRMRVLVDETGKVADCKVYDMTETDYLESPACKEMKRAAFDPALDASGNAVKSFYQTTIIYRTS